ncbi:MAG: type II toxin-antitoxin system ParD family antitoxin [Planctomycetota bacterium]|nr:type II toxin-antitoxin system ParD family antitoxin [Planctomycetota bacterium]
MARQTTLNVSLTSTLRQYVHSKVESGRYESASEVIRDSSRAIQEREQAAETFWSGVRAKVAVARRDVAEGRTEDGESAMDEILAAVKADEPPPQRKRRR